MNEPSHHNDPSVAASNQVASNESTPPHEVNSSHEAMRRHRRRVAHSRTPDEQALVVQQLQTAAMEAIQSDPVAYDAFLKRNYRKRRPEAVAQLLAEMMKRS